MRQRSTSVLAGLLGPPHYGHMDQAESCLSCISRRVLLGGAAAAALVAGAAPLENVAALVPANTDVAATSAIPLRGGRVFTVAGKPVVVTQPKKGVFKAFTGVCTHEGCTVNRVSNNRISCPCHGAAFDANNGKRVAGPARAPLAAVPIRVSRGRIVVLGATASATASAAAQPSGSTTSEVPAGYRLLAGSLPSVGNVAVMSAGSTLVLVHRTASGLNTFSAVCPHAGETREWASKLVNGRIVCEAHYRSFDPQSGAGPQGLELKRLKNVAVGDGWAVQV